MHIAMLISGGVDSSVALRLLKDAGHEVTAYYLKIWLDDELDFLGECPWEEDLNYVRQICKEAEVPLEIIPMQQEYFDNVVKYTLDEVKAGRTPNPDIFCNNRIKFGLFIEHLEKSGQNFDKIASGHYAQIEEVDGVYYLKRSPDTIKDQTYFLSHLSQEQLSKIMFPIGHLPKSEVRALAQKYDLPNKDRKDSQGICFLGKVKFSEFVKHYLGTKKGDLIEWESGEKIGEHEGFWYYTRGQRKGIGLAGGPWFVVKKDVEKNIVYISREYEDTDDPEKKRNSFEVAECNWFAGHPPTEKGLEVKLRHGEHMYTCTLDIPRVTINGQDQGIAAGQFAVFYHSDRCLGSGIIRP